MSRGGEKVTLGSFLFRDDCHTLLLRLVKVSGSISLMHGESPATPTGALPLEDSSDELPQDAPPEPSETAPGTAISRALAVADRPGDSKFETMVDAVLPCTTAQVHADPEATLAGTLSALSHGGILALLFPVSHKIAYFPVVARCMSFPAHPSAIWM